MYNQSITSFRQLIKYFVKQKTLFTKFGLKKFKGDGVENLLLRLTIKGLWLFIIFQVSLSILSLFQKDLFYSTLFLFFNFILTFALPSNLQGFVRGDFFDKLGGNLLKYILIVIILFYTACFIKPGWLIPYVNKMLKRYEK